ncbi:Lar family restriction alleviation protein [Chitinibacter tainanensis]|uniref:Lar family restriction alleviation protein n=1 Tax=Chitinibacter tainanensis TaxID=230667 RepID=UPI002355367E|nr:Lar family restriction alleviation protein [Chitinibacter tainanensis]
MSMSPTNPTPTISAQACPKCGAPAEPQKAGSNRYWVQCSKFGKNGNCNAISQQGSSKKEAIANWNKLR